MNTRGEAYDEARKNANEKNEPYVTIQSLPPYPCWIVLRLVIVNEFIKVMQREAPDFAWEAGDRLNPASWS